VGQCEKHAASLLISIIYYFIQTKTPCIPEFELLVKLLHQVEIWLHGVQE